MNVLHHIQTDMISTTRCRKLSLFLFPFLLLLLGCNTFSDLGIYKKPKLNINIKPLQKGRQLTDIPAPRKANFQQDQSFIYQRPDYRVAKLVYMADGAVKHLISFYRNRMKRHKWTRISQNSYDERRSLLFKKDMERCIISVRNHGDQARITIIIGLQPELM